MYICVCYGISDTAIKQAMDEGARDYRDIADNLGAGACCGMCVREVKEMLADYRQEKTGFAYATPVLFEPA